jgi:hypothetical protein
MDAGPNPADILRDKKDGPMPQFCNLSLPIRSSVGGYPGN